jgi:hypothetical protein
MAFRFGSRALLVALSLVAVPSLAAAQDLTPRPDFYKFSFTPEPASRGSVPAFDLSLQAPDDTRPSLLMSSLYATTVITQSLDVHSTMKALNAGAVEGNPMMSYLTSHPVAFGAVKAATAAGLIYAGRSLAKRNKKHAVIALVAVNAAYVFVAAHNYRVASRMKASR